MIGIVLARRYARAIIDLARESGQVAEIGEELNRIGGLFDESPELVHLFTDPTVDSARKEMILEEILGKGGIQDLTRRFVHVLLSKDRLLGIGEIARAYRTLSDQLGNRIRAKVVSAAPLEEAEESRIRETLARIAEREVILEIDVDEDILGGIIVHMGSQVYDGSIRNQLQRIKENLSKGR